MLIESNSNKTNSRAKIFNRVLNIKRAVSRKLPKIRASSFLPSIDIKTMGTEPEIDLVKKLDMNQRVENFFNKEMYLKRNKSMIDNNENVKLKRLGLKIPPENNIGKNKISDNKQVEEFLEEELKDELSKLENKKNEYDKIQETLCKVYKEDFDNDIESHIYDKYQKELNKIVEKELKNYAKTHKKERQKIYTLKYEEKNKRIHRINELKELKEENKQIIFNLKEKLNLLKNEIEIIRKKIYDKRHELNEKYLYDLYEGLSFKGEGLISIIKSIWNLGMDVDITFMPSYLDKQSIEFLFKKTKLIIQISKLRQLINEARIKFINDVQGLNIFINDEDNIKNENKNKDSSFFPTRLIYDDKPKTILDLYPKTKEFMEKYEKEILNEQKEYKISRMVNENFIPRISPIIVSKYEDVEKLKYALVENERKLRQIEKNELNRISKEFVINDYGNIHNVDFNTVASALCGEDNIDEGILNYNTMLKNYQTQKKLIKFYSTYKHEKM